MAPVGRLYRRTMWRGIGAPTWLGYGVWLAPMAYGWLGYGVQGVARLWRMDGACGVWMAPVAYGWRLWRAGCAYGVQGAPMACRVRIVWTVYSVRLSCLCVVHVSCLCVVMVAPICRHGCVAMACGYPLGLRSIGYGSKA